MERNIESQRMKTVTLYQLRGACASQRELFKTLFGDSVEVTDALCLEHAASFDWDWAAKHLLTSTALAEYERVRASALAEYNRVCAPAWAEYDRMCAPAWAEYERVCASALAEYNRVGAPAWAEYNRVCAAAFARLYLTQGSAA